MTVTVRTSQDIKANMLGSISVDMSHENNNFELICRIISLAADLKNGRNILVN